MQTNFQPPSPYLCPYDMLQNTKNDVVNIIIEICALNPFVTSITGSLNSTMYGEKVTSLVKSFTNRNCKI